MRYGHFLSLAKGHLPNPTIPLKSFFIFLGILTLFHSVSSSFYDPHVYPERGPFFEGWYIRITDFANEQSIGVLFGNVLKTDQSSTLPPVLVSILHSNGTRPLAAYNRFLMAESVNMTVDGGKPVTRNPDQRSPANFRWEAHGCGFLDVRPNLAYFRFTVEGFTLYANISSVKSWDRDGAGPQGWLTHLGLPLNWFVYSVGSIVTEYGWESKEHGGKVKSFKSVGNQVVAHMEKNWGKSFPRGWYWGQGVTQGGVYFAMSGGPVDFGPVAVNGHLIGYRNPAKGISYDYRPDNSVARVKMDACSGTFNLTVESPLTMLQVNVELPLDSLSDCLYGPVENGFMKVCVESFVATVEIQASRRDVISFGQFTEIDNQRISNAAFEFGGNFVCNRKCGASSELGF